MLLALRSMGRWLMRGEALGAHFIRMVPLPYDTRAMASVADDDSTVNTARDQHGLDMHSGPPRRVVARVRGGDGGGREQDTRPPIAPEISIHCLLA